MKEKTIYALGFFDGVHLGHQALLQACGELAERENCNTGVVTFASHPDGLVFGTPPKLLNTAQDRRRLLKAFGIQKVVELPFDEQLMHMPWQSFFKLLAEDYGAAGFVCGADFRFGYRGQGCPELLQEACREQNMPCRVVPQQKLGGITVSSTYIRSLLEAGDLERASQFLAHPHLFTGTVVPGRKLGRTIGVPTANLELPEELVQPKLGVYACKVAVEGNTYLAVTNVGRCPTVGGHKVTVEPWLLDFDGDLYGKEMTVEFHAFLRPEEKFENLTALQAQICKDAEKTRAFFLKK